MRERRYRRERGGPLTTVAIVALVPTLVAAGVWVADGARSPLDSESRPGPLIVPVAASEHRATAQVAVVATSEPGFPGVILDGGRVTSLRVAVGTELHSGDPVLEVEDRTIIAAQSDRPLWRDLRGGMQGPDVQTLQTLLAELGHFDEDPDGKFGPQTALAVREFNEEFRGDGRDATFHRGALVWIGAEPLRVGEVTIRAGEILTEATVIFRGEESVASVEVSEPTGGSLPSGEYELVVGQTRVPYSLGSGTVEGDDAGRVFGAMSGTEGVGLLAAAEAEHVVTVPPSAVVVDGSGQLCVFSDADSGPTPVEVVSGGVNTTQIRPVPELATVLANPADVIEELVC